MFVVFVVYLISSARLFATPWTIALQTLLSTGFLKQEYWIGLPFPPLGNLPNTRIKPMSPALAGGFFTTEPQGIPSPKKLFPYKCSI